MNPYPVQLPDPLRAPLPPPVQATAAETQGQKPSQQTRFRSTPTLPGSPQMMGTQAADADIKFPNNLPLQVNVEGLPLPAFINEVFGNLLGLSFEIETTLQAKKDLVTLRVSEPQMPPQLYKLARQILDNYGVTLLKQGDIFRFVPITSPSLGEPPLLVSGFTLPDVPISHRPIFQLVPLKVVRHTQIANWLKLAYASPKLQILEDAERNAIVLIGPPELVGRVLEAIRFLDQPHMRSRYSTRIEPVFLNADDLATQLATILNNEGYTTPGPNNPYGSVIVLPLKTTNTLIIFAADEQILEHVKKWAATLDAPGYLSTKKEGLFFYPVQNTKAENLARVLSPLLQGLFDAPAPPAPNTTTAPATLTAKKLVVDSIRNALLYQGDAESWARLLPILKEMDQPAKLILVEVTIAEVTLTDQDQFGIQWLLSGVGINGLDGTLGTTALGVGSSGLTYTLNSAGQTRLLLSAFASSNRVTVLSSPRLMVKSGEAATINVGTEVPILTAQVTDPTTQRGGTSGILQQIQYRRTGVQLSVKPTAHAGNRIDLDITQEVSNAEANTTSNISSPTIFNRSIDTKLSVSDGGSILLGGLISGTTSQGTSGIPILSDIPVIGNLFRTDKQTVSRTELIIVIVPYVISNDREAQQVTDAFRQRLSVDAPSNPKKNDEIPTLNKP